MKTLKLDLISRLRGIHSAIDDALGDSDVVHLDGDELRDVHPAQWAAQRLAEIINELDTPPKPDQRSDE
jgi:hypothetical protein